MNLAKIAIVTPVLDDWAAFGCLLREVSRSLSGEVQGLEIIAVDDGSAQPFAIGALELPAGPIRRIEILRLGLNLGHQRAIAVGLVDIARRDDLDGVFVMDCDGEDRPTDLPRLLAVSRERLGQIVVAQRTERSEGRPFKIGYALYRWLFTLLTGQQINFGNFSFMPIACARRLVFMPEIWNNLPAAILRSRIRHVAVPTARGERYFGRSRMSWIGLITHGLSATSVYIDIVFVRLLFGAAIVGSVALAGIAAAVAIRFATPLAIPGWATTVVGVLGLLLMQLVVMVVAMLLLVLAGRNSRPIVPIVDAGMFIADRQRFDNEPVSPLARECRGTDERR
jgi:polyisoprenyl-phosphate glycosyltransferase